MSPPGPELGVVAAGHPVSARTGAEVLAEGGNAVDAALGAMLASFACEPLLTGLGAGGYMLVVKPGEQPVLLDFFVGAPGRGADPARGLVDLFSRRNSPTAFITPSGAAELSERCAFARSLCVVARCGWG